MTDSDERGHDAGHDGKHGGSSSGDHAAAAATSLFAAPEVTEAQAKSFCYKFVGLVIAGLMATCLVNFFVNPYAQYPPRFFEPLVHASRAKKVALLKRRAAPVDALVLGSSRVMKLEPDVIETETQLQCFNAGMNYAKPEDYLAFLRFVIREKQAAPRLVIVGIDVAGFSNVAPIDARLVAQPELGPLVPEATGLEGRFKRWQELLSWSQTGGSAKSLVRTALALKNGPKPAKESYRDDGLLIYHEREQQIADGTYDFEGALDYNRREYIHLMAGYDRLSPMRQQVFEQIVELCGEHDCQLVVFLTPLHPRLRETLVAETDYLDRKHDVQDYLLSLANARDDMAYVDLSEVNTFDGDPSKFVDGIHPLEPNTRKMLAKLIRPKLSTTQSENGPQLTMTHASHLRD